MLYEILNAACKQDLAGFKVLDGVTDAALN